MLRGHLIQSFRSLLPAGRIYTTPSSLISYEVDGGLDKGLPEAVAFPVSAAEVQRIVLWAVEHHVPLIARGAGTGLSGGSVALLGGIILDFSHMQHPALIDTQSRRAVVEPAFINLRLDEQARLLGLYFPPDPSSQRVSTVGGNVSENSGGPHCFKYGVTTNYVVGMDAVLPDGSLLHLGGLACDYPAYDLMGLITGSEGTLALITSITFRLVRNPPAVKTLLAIFENVEQAGVAVSAVIVAGLVPATMEMMDNKIIRIIEPFAHANLPLDAGAVLIIEFDGYQAGLNDQVDEVVRILKIHGASGMRVAQDEEERGKIWLARKSAAGALAREVPAHYTVDITVPRSLLAETLIEINHIAERYQLRLGHVFHAGDGNLHPMVLVPDPDDHEFMERMHTAGREMVACAVARGGSLTGEHGVGIEKRAFMPLMHEPQELLTMWDVKETFDPQGVLNPGKVFPVSDRPDEPFAGYNSAHELLATTSETEYIPEEFYAPWNAQEMALQLRQLSFWRQPVIITSACHTEAHHPFPQLSTMALKGVLSFSPDDLSITVGSATPLAQIQEYLFEYSMQLALASPWPNATIGGLVASNHNAPLRLRYGGLRDHVLCATVALPDGRLIRTGRPVVKNVAGYDLTKIFVGSYGTLGVLTDISLKVISQPRAQRTLVIPVNTLHEGLYVGNLLLTMALNASALLFCENTLSELSVGPDGRIPSTRYMVVYSVDGMLQDVEAELQEAREVLTNAPQLKSYEVESLVGTALWADMLAQKIREEHVIVRMGVPGKDLASFMEMQASYFRAGTFLVDLGSGFIYTWRERAFPDTIKAWLKVLRQLVLLLNGYAIVFSAPVELISRLDCWGYVPDSLPLMRRLKARWDPSMILNPHAFIV